MPKKDGFKFFYAISLALQLGFIIAVPILGFLWIGSWFDAKFNTSSLFLLLGIFIGVAITVYEVYHLLIPLMTNNTKDDD